MGIPYSHQELARASAQPTDVYHRELMAWAATEIERLESDRSSRLREQITSLTKERDTLDAQLRMVVRASDMTRVDRAALREQIEKLPRRKRAMTTNSETEWFEQVDLADVLALLDDGQETLK